MPCIIIILMLLLLDAPPHIIYQIDASFTSYRSIFWIMFLGSALTALVLLFMSVTGFIWRRTESPWQIRALYALVSASLACMAYLLLFHPDAYMTTNCFGPVGDH